MGRREAIVFVLISSVIATFHYGLSYGIGDHGANLAQVMRLMDNSLFSNDIVTTQIDEYGVRFFIFNLFAILGKLISLEVLAFVGVLLINFFTLYITFRIAEDIFPDLRLAPVLAVVLVASINNNPIDDYGMITQYLVPRRVAMPLSFLCVWSAIKNKPVQVGVYALLASMCHPFLATNAAIVSFGGIFIAIIIGLFTKGEPESGSYKSEIIKLVIGGAIFVTGSWLLWIVFYDSSAIDNDILFRVLTFRDAPRFTPIAYYGIKAFAYFGMFILGSLYAWKWWHKNRTIYPDSAGDFHFRVLGIIISIVMLFAASLIFVEVYPVAFWLKLEGLDVVVLGHWLGLILLARSISAVIENYQTGRSDSIISAVIMLLGSGKAQPMLMLTGHICESVRKRFSSVIRKDRMILLSLMIMLLAGVIIIRYGEMRVSFSLLLFSSVAFWFIIIPKKRYRVLVPTLITILMIPGLLLARHTGFLGSFTSAFSSLVTFEDAHYMPKWGSNYQQIDEIATFARNNTHKNAILLSPPLEDRFRVISERALVIGYKTIITTPTGMPEWLERIRVCYGETNKDGLRALEDLDKNYREITLDQLLTIRKKYGADFAFIYSETPNIDLPVLFQNKKYRFVDLSPLDIQFSNCFSLEMMNEF